MMRVGWRILRDARPHRTRNENAIMSLTSSPAEPAEAASAEAASAEAASTEAASADMSGRAPSGMRARWLSWLVQGVLTLLLLAAPVASVSLYLDRSFDASLNDTMQLWTDEVYYWHQVKSMRAVGMDSGYYTTAEVPAPAGTTWYTWTGPVIPAFYAAISAPFGWGLSSMVWANLLLVSASIGLYLLMVRPGVMGTLLLGAAVLTFPPLWLYATTTLLPLMQMALAVALAGGFVVILRGRPPVWVVVVTGALLLFAGLVRITWAPLLLVYAGLLTRHRRWPWQMAALLLAVGLMGLQAFAFQWLSAPYPSVFVTSISDGFGVSLADGLAAVENNIRSNLAILDQGDVLERAMRWQMVALLLAMLLWAIGLAVQTAIHRRNIRRITPHDAAATLDRLIRENRQNIKTWLEIAFHTLNVLSVLVFVLVVYDMREWRDFRLLAPRLLLSLLVLLGCRRWLLATVGIASFVLLIPATATVTDIWSEFHISPQRQAEYETYREQLAPLVVYDADAPSPWCNTLLFSPPYWYSLTQLVIAAEPGIGLTTWTPEFPLRPPYRSRYVLVTDDEADDLGLTDDYVPLLTVPSGRLYRNDTVPCE